jgi:hypothetical protein
VKKASALNFHALGPSEEFIPTLLSHAGSVGPDSELRGELRRNWCADGLARWCSFSKSSPNSQIREKSVLVFATMSALVNRLCVFRNSNSDLRNAVRSLASMSMAVDGINSDVERDWTGCPSVEIRANDLVEVQSMSARSPLLYASRLIFRQSGRVSFPPGP